jgi:signal peptidase I
MQTKKIFFMMKCSATRLQLPVKCNPVYTSQMLKTSDKETNLSLISFVLTVIAIVVPIRVFVAKPFIVSGTSMYPTFDSWHYLIIDELTYRFNAPERGDVIVMKYPLDTSRYFIKRIIGLPGETVILKGTTVTIKNKMHPEGMLLNESYLVESEKSEDDMAVELRQDEYFVMGDNRKASADSRFWGTLPKNDIIGRALVRLFPFTKIGYKPGAIESL